MSSQLFRRVFSVSTVPTTHNALRWLSSTHRHLQQQQPPQPPSSSSISVPMTSSSTTSATSTTAATNAGQSSSILSQHMSSSLKQLAQLYSHRYADLSKEFPCHDPRSEEEGEDMMRFFCSELDVGFDSLQKWRAAQRSAGNMRRKFAGRDGRVDRVALGKLLAPSAPVADQAFLSSMILDLHAVLSPFVSITPTRAGIDCTAGTQLTATRDIEAGVFLCSIPTSAGLTANPPPSDDRLLNFLMSIEDLIGQLLAAEGRIAPPQQQQQQDGDLPPSHAAYVAYLKETVVPPKNLPYLSLRDLLTYHDGPLATKGGASSSQSDQQVGNNLASCSSPLYMTEATVGGATSIVHSNSGAQDIWDFFHNEMGGQPLSEVLREALTPDEYRWYVSVVLSRRLRSGLLVPLIDKLNHHHEPNCYFTMASENEFCALDVFDNMISGVDPLYLHEPFLHVFSITKIAKGEPITMSYLDRGVKTAEDRDVWQLAWGFTPEQRAVYTEPELLEVAGLVAARRMQQRSSLFP